MRVLLVDNYDSFTWNLVHLLIGAGDAVGDAVDVRVVRNDAIAVNDALAADCDGIVLSPGPDTPADAGICIELVRAAAGRLPVFGVCLGQQIIAEVFGARTVLATEVGHGTAHPITHDGAGVFDGVPSPLPAMRYHSLVVEPASIPACLQATAWLSADAGVPQSARVPMALRHRELPIAALQFHPESVGTPSGRAIAANVLRRFRAGQDAEGA